jgi:hypothetical protein
MLGEPLSTYPISTARTIHLLVGVVFNGRAALAGLASAVFQPAAALAANASLQPAARRVRFAAAGFAAAATLSAQALFRIYSATREFITRPADQLANTPFHGTLQKALRWDRSILGGRRIGEFTAGWGELELINAEGDYDHLIERYAIDGRRVVVRVGAAGAAYDSFRTLFDGTAADWEVREDVLRVYLRDNGYKLEVPAQPNSYGGAGGLDGNDDLKGRRKPRAFGRCLNLSPPMLIPAELVYQVNDGPVDAVTAVYDRAVALSPAGDFASAAALRAATTGAAGSGKDIEAGEFATCLSAGLLRLGGSPVGTVTCDLRGDKAGGVYAERTADIVRRLVVGTGRLSDPGELSLPSFDAVNADQPATIGIWLDGSDRTVADVVAELMGAVGGWGGLRRNGRFEVRIFKAPAGVPTGRYDKVDIVEIGRERLPGDLSPPPWRFRQAWGRNWTVQTDVDGQAGITPARIAFLKEAYRLAEGSSPAIRADRPLGKDIDPVPSFFADEGPALVEAQRQLALYGQTALYRLTMKSQAFIHDVGDVIHVTYPRWNLSEGRLLAIVSISEDTDENIVEIVGFG